MARGILCLMSMVRFVPGGLSSTELLFTQQDSTAPAMRGVQSRRQCCRSSFVFARQEPWRAYIGGMSMPSDSGERLHVVTLARHPTVRAVIRSADWSVLFTSAGQRGTDLHTLKVTVAEHEAPLLERKPRVGVRRAHRLHVYLVVAEQCNLQ